MNKNDNGMYQCKECGKEFEKAGSCALHEYRKHNIKKEKETPTEKPGTETTTDTSNEWIFLCKKQLSIKGKTVGMKMQRRAKENGFMEINKITGDCR